MNDLDRAWERKELYEKVWSQPLRTLAAEYGISDVALGKICRKLQIPLPGPGHWTRIQCGHQIPRPPLPAGKDLPVLLRQTAEPKTPPLAEDLPKLEVIHRIEKSASPLVTKAMLAHPLVEIAKRALETGRINDRGVLWPAGEVCCLDLRVSKSCLSRALGIIAATVHILEREGFKVHVEKGDKESTSAIIYGEAIRFGIVERSRQVKPAPVSVSNKSYLSDSIRLEPTGRLSFEVWTYSTGGLRKVWRDQDRASLENQLPKCIAGMVKIALYERAIRDAREKKEAAKKQKVDEITESLRRIEEEEKKIKALKRNAVAWFRAERMRNYIAAVQTHLNQQQYPNERRNLMEWIEWAKLQADRADPLKESPASVVDNKDQVIRQLQSVRWSW
jgi:hypothetical protein